MTQTRRFSGANLRRLRLGKGWTQAELADHAGIRRERQIIRWENSQNEPRLDAAMGLARALGVPVDALFTADDEEAALSGETFRSNGTSRSTPRNRKSAKRTPDASKAEDLAA